MSNAPSQKKGTVSQEKNTDEEVRSMPLREQKYISRSMPLREQKYIANLFKVLEYCNLKKEHQDLDNIVEYVNNMEKRFDGVMEELKTVREQLNQIQDKGTRSTMTMIADQTQGKVKAAGQALTAFKSDIIAKADNAVKLFKEKGKEVLRTAVEKMRIPQALEVLKTHFANTKKEMGESADKVHIIREEIYRTKEHAKNVGKAIMGKQISESEMPDTDKGLLGKIEKHYETSKSRFERMEELTDHCIKGIEKLNPAKEPEQKEPEQKDTAQNTAKPRKSTAR